jgi:hypothetical protein
VVERQAHNEHDCAADVSHVTSRVEGSGPVSRGFKHGVASVQRLTT